MFQPERWEDDLEKRLPRGVYIPFGDGSRICIGKGFALMEAVLLRVDETYIEVKGEWKHGFVDVAAVLGLLK